MTALLAGVTLPLVAMLVSKSNRAVIARFSRGILFFLGIAPAALLGHHSFSAEYDEKQPVHVSGVVTKVEWANPHIWYYVDVKSPDGKVVNWAFSGGAPGQLMRRGITHDSIRAGMLVKVDGYRAKDGSNNAFGQQVTFPDQQSVVTGTPAEQSAGK